MSVIQNGRLVLSKSDLDFVELFHLAFQAKGYAGIRSLASTFDIADLVQVPVLVWYKVAQLVILDEKDHSEYLCECLQTVLEAVGVLHDDV